MNTDQTIIKMDNESKPEVPAPKPKDNFSFCAVISICINVAVLPWPIAYMLNIVPIWAELPVVFSGLAVFFMSFFWLSVFLNWLFD